MLNIHRELWRLSEKVKKSAFAWINWIILTILIVIAIGIAAANHGWNKPMHGRWDPRGRVYRDSRTGPQR
ncbi:hypothetical protein L218DRAFT_1010016 [Marasmius fiardii PR-910]|nr:hypothetical protein L218DRAFT_1010016 [Marasmius fiardii PR-910]